MRIIIAFFVMYLPLLLLGQSIEPKQQWVQGGALKLYAQIYQSKELSQKPALLIVLHGDAPFIKPSYQYKFASRAAASNANLIAVALLRPGYTDPNLNRSDGERGNTTGDNWNATNTDAIAAAIETLTKQWNADQVIMAGHSGGSAITANIIGRHPKLVDTALLVSLPSDLEAWRKHMLDFSNAHIFSEPIQSLSALDLLPKVDQETKIHLIIGAQDEITPLWLSERYHEKAIKLGKRADLTILPEKGHEIFMDQKVFDHIASSLAR